MAILQNFWEEDIKWKAPWLILDRILYRYGSFDWVPLLEIWRAVGYAPLLVLRQYNSRQFVPATHGLAQCEFLYRGDNFKKKVKEIFQIYLLRALLFCFFRGFLRRLRLAILESLLIVV
ncbi:hypothetical protein Gotur_017809 [Gossypium turneri]